jgi:hypothetical protein
MSAVTAPVTQDAPKTARKPRKAKDPNAPAKPKKVRTRVLLAIFLGDSPLVKEFRAEKRPDNAEETWKGRSAKALFNAWYNDEEKADERPATVPVLFEGVKIRLQSKA